MVQKQCRSNTASLPRAQLRLAFPGFPYDDPRLMDSTGALKLEDIPKRMLIIGGGIIGLEMATVYDALGSRISVVELMDQLIPGADPDLDQATAQAHTETLRSHLPQNQSHTESKRCKKGLKVTFESASG